jgi:hypothetical protein
MNRFNKFLGVYVEDVWGAFGGLCVETRSTADAVILRKTWGFDVNVQDPEYILFADNYDGSYYNPLGE